MLMGSVTAVLDDWRLREVSLRCMRNLDVSSLDVARDLSNLSPGLPASSGRGFGRTARLCTSSDIDVWLSSRTMPLLSWLAARFRCSHTMLFSHLPAPAGTCDSPGRRVSTLFFVSVKHIVNHVSFAQIRFKNNL